MAEKDRLARQIEFLLEIDKLTGILRHTWLTSHARRENDAEHSWHLAVMAVVLSEYAAEELDLSIAVKMVLFHDLVEIDAGDTFVYDAATAGDKLERERAAAERIFNILPVDRAAEFRGLWEEYEARATPESRYAAALDRLQPMLRNYHTQGRAWQEHDVTSVQVLALNRHMADGAPKLWEYARQLIRDAVEKGYLHH